MVKVRAVLGKGGKGWRRGETPNILNIVAFRNNLATFDSHQLATLTLNHCLEWYKSVLTNLDHVRQWFNTLIPPSHESPVVYFVCRSFSELRCRPSLLQMQGCQ